MIAVEPFVMQAAPERDTPYNLVMKIWVRWMHLSDSATTGGDGNLQDSKEFMASGEAVDAMVSDLPRVQWWAVHKARGLSTAVWRFPETSMADALEDAEGNLIPKMRKHIALKRFFN